MSILYFRNSDGNFIQIPSIPGKSAYEIAVEKGVFSGTEEEFAQAQIFENKELIDSITEERVESWDNKSDFSGSYNDLTNKPTNVSEFVNDSNYVTNEELADELQTLHTHDNKEILDNITQEDVDLWTEGGNIDLTPYQTIEDNTLETEEKNIPGAINELNEYAIIFERDGANDLEVFENYPDLATDDKTIIGAINELDNRLDNISEVVDEQLSSSLTDHIQYQHPSVNSTDELDIINTKKLADGTLAFVKEEEAYYYYTKTSGWQILKTGGTGDGGGSTSAYISSTDAENLIVSTGEDLELHLDFSSPNAGRGTLKIFINDVNSLNVSLAQGETTTVIDGELFSKGNNTLTVYVLDRVGSMSNSLTFYVRYGGTEITTDFDYYSSYDYGAVVRFYFVASALDTSQLLSFYMKIDNQLQGSVSCSSDVRSYYTFPNTLSVGSHYCEAWVEDESGTKSNPLTFNLIILDNTSLVVSSEQRNVTIEEGSQLSIAYKVYMKNNFSFITKTYINGNLANTGTCTLETAYYRTSTLTEGIHTIKIEVWDTTETVSDYVTVTVNVTGSTYEMLTPITAGSTFLASAINKTNSDENNAVWIGTNQDNQEVVANLYNFAFNSESGWVDDNLIISGNSYVEVPITPLSENAKYGFTLDIEFSSKQIGVEDAQVLTLWNETDNCGIKITTEQLIIRSKSGKQCALYFTDNENTSAMFIIDRNEGFAKIYINGVMCEAFALSDYEAGGVDYLEDFTVNDTIKLGGSGHCKIKNLRVYQIALTTDEILNNFMANETNKEAQKSLVEFQKGNELPTLTIYGDFSGLGKDDKKPCDIVYLSPDTNKYGESFSLLGKHSQLQYQGTSSMAYPIKNYRINPRDKDGKVKINPFNADGGQEESRFTLKAD